MINEIPMGDVARFVRGITFKPEDVCDNYSDDSVVCMRTKNVQSTLETGDLISVPSAFVRRKEQRLQTGDLLISSANSWNLVGKACWVPKLGYDATAGGFISILRCDRKALDPRYFYHWVTSGETQHNLRNCGRQTTNISNLDFDRATALPIPLPHKNGKPDLEEQKRIAAILDKADGIRRKRQQALRLTDDFLRSVFLDMFGDPVTNPMGWDEIEIGNISNVQGGLQLTPKRQDFPLTRSYLRVANVYRGALWLDEIKELKLTEKEFERTKLETGDILVVEGHGNPNEIGRCAIWDGSIANCVHQNHLIRIRSSREIAIPEFLSAFLNSDGGSRKLKGQSVTTSGLNTISVSKVRGALVQLPPLGLQLQFRSITEGIRKTKALIEAEFNQANDLFASFQQRAFRGEL